jgi:hypothetical protein
MMCIATVCLDRTPQRGNCHESQGFISGIGNHGRGIEGVSSEINPSGLRAIRMNRGLASVSTFAEREIVFGSIQNRIPFVTVLVTILTLSPLVADDETRQASERALRLPYPERTIRVGYWLDNRNGELMTPEMIDWIGQRASLVIYNGNVDPVDPYFRPEAILARFKAQFPDLPVLLYQWTQLASRGNGVGSLPNATIRSHTVWLVRDNKDQVVTFDNGRRVWIDIAQPGAVTPFDGITRLLHGIGCLLAC